MGHRLRCLQDFAAEGLDAMVECGNPNCRRRVVADPRRLLEGIRKERWIHLLSVQRRHMRCGQCGHRGARIAPVPRILGPLDCEEFRADIRRLWERVMAEDFSGKCNAEIAAPDGDGLVYVVSKEDRSVKMACLGTREEALALVTEWAGAYDNDRPLE